MKSSKTELLVGIFALLVILILSLMTFRVGEFRFGEKKGYKIYAFFENTAGLAENTKVKIAGVDAGTVEKIELFAGKARVTLRMYEGVVLYSDAYATIKSTGILGDKYLEISSGSTPPVLVHGNTIKESREVAEIGDLVKNITDLTTKVTELVAEISTPEVRESLKQTVFNIRDATADLKYTIAGNKDRVSTILANIEELTDSLKTESPEMIANLKKASSDLKDLLADAGPQLESIARRTEGVMNSVDSIAGKIDRGEGTIGKLVNDPSLYNSISGAATGLSNTLSRIERFRTFITFKGDYLEDQKEAKGQFLLTLQPRRERYYILGIVTDPVGTVDTTETTINGTTIVTETVDEDLEFTAQFAHRFNSTALRIGLTESTFGLGADQFFLNDKLKVSLDAWDFGENEEEAENPHLRAGADFFIFKSLFLSAGYDNFLNSKRRGYYIGAGVRFEDEDFKYIFGSVPSIPGQ